MKAIDLVKSAVALILGYKKLLEIVRETIKDEQVLKKFGEMEKECDQWLGSAHLLIGKKVKGGK